MLNSSGREGGQRPPLIDAHEVCLELPNPKFWQRNLSSLKCEYVTQSAGINLWYKCHGLFDNFPVMTTVKSCLKCHSIH